MPIEGFAKAANVTGGAGGTSIVVTNLNASGAGSLKAAWESLVSPRIITFTPGLSGTITLTLHMFAAAGNCTLDGAGANITISGACLRPYSSSNVGQHNFIIKNLTFINTLAESSTIYIAFNSSRVWVDHCTFTNNSVGNIGQPIAIYNDDGYDNGGAGVTASWCRFNTPNKKAFQVGSDGDAVEPPSQQQVSIHHCWFNGSSARNPRVHHDATVHMWNNYIYSWVEYGIGCSELAWLLSENDIYQANGDADATIYDYGASAGGYGSANALNVTGAWLTGTPTPILRQIGTFPRSKITYTYTLEPADAALRTKIMAQAGANNEVVDPDPPPPATTVVSFTEYKEIAWHNPITNGLAVAAMPTGSTFINFVNGETASLAGTAPLRVDANVGTGLDFTAASLTFLKAGLNGSTGDHSIVILVRDGGGSQPWVTACSIDANWSLYVGGTGGEPIPNVMLDGLATSPAFMAGFDTTPGVIQQVGYSYQGTPVAIAAYLDGVAGNSGTLGANSWADNAPFRIGAGQGTEYFDSEMFMLLAWNRALRADEFKSLADDIGQVFEGVSYLQALSALTAPADTIPPTITAQFPLPFAEAVARNEPIEVTFSEAMLESSLTSATMFVELAFTPFTLMPTTVSYNPATRVATLTPIGLYAVYTVYRITVKGGGAGVKDISSNPLAVDVTWTFRTVQSTYIPDQTPPYELLLDTTTLTNGTHTVVAVAVDEDGNVTSSISVPFTVSNP
jgi:pectate lyase